MFVVIEEIGHFHGRRDLLQKGFDILGLLEFLIKGEKRLVLEFLDVLLAPAEGSFADFEESPADRLPEELHFRNEFLH